MQGSQHDHGNDAGQEQRNHEGVDNTEVVYFVLWIPVQVCIPPVRPRHVTLAPPNVVGEDDLFKKHQMIYEVHKTSREEI